MPLVAARANAGAFGLGWSAAGAGEELGGMVLLTPTSIAYTGTSASIGTNGSVEFNTCSSLTLNGVFSADYDNYVVSINAKNTTSNAGARYRLTSGGVPESSANYTFQLFYADSTTTGQARYSSQTGAEFAGFSSTGNNGLKMILGGPHLAQITTAYTYNAYTSGNASCYILSSTHALTNSYDGFNFFPNSNSLTGEISIYGLGGSI